MYENNAHGGLAVGTHEVTITKVRHEEKVEMPAGKHCNVMVIALGGEKWIGQWKSI